MLREEVLEELDHRERFDDEGAVVELEGRDRSERVPRQVLGFLVTPLHRVDDDLFDAEIRAERLTLGDVQHHLGRVRCERYLIELHAASPTRSTICSSSSKRSGPIGTPSRPSLRVETPTSRYFANRARTMSAVPERLELRDHRVGHARGGLVALSVQPELLDGARVVLVTRTLERVVVEVGARRAHAAHVERDARPTAVDHRLDVIADLHAYRNAPVELGETAASVVGARGEIVHVRFRVIRREGRSEPAVRGLARVLQGIRSERREIDRNIHRLVGDADRLALAVRQRQLMNLAVVADLLAREDEAADLDGFAQARERFPVRHAVQALDHLRSARAKAEDESPVGHIVQRQRSHRGHGRRARRHLRDARGELDALGLVGQIGERREGIAPPGLGRERELYAEALRVLNPLHHLVPIVRSQRSDLDRQLHLLRAPFSSMSCPIRRRNRDSGPQSRRAFASTSAPSMADTISSAFARAVLRGRPSSSSQAAIRSTKRSSADAQFSAPSRPRGAISSAAVAIGQPSAKSLRTRPFSSVRSQRSTAATRSLTATRPMVSRRCACRTPVRPRGGRRPTTRSLPRPMRPCPRESSDTAPSSPAPARGAAEG